MDTIETINAHRSIRRYEQEPITEAALQTILQAAIRASTSGNMQTFSIIVTREKKRREMLWEIHGKQDMIKEAPLLLTFCVDWNRMDRWCRASDADPGYDNFLSFLVGFADALIAAQNAALAAEALGLGICYIGTTLCSASDLTDFFELPEGVHPATTLVIGKPAELPDLRARLPLGSIVHDERYRDFDDARITETYRKRETEGWARYMAIPELASMIRESGASNLAQVYTRVKYPKEENIKISRELLQSLTDQGFMGQYRQKKT